MTSEFLKQSNGTASLPAPGEATESLSGEGPAKKKTQKNGTRMGPLTRLPQFHRCQESNFPDTDGRFAISIGAVNPCAPDLPTVALCASASSPAYQSRAISQTVGGTGYLGRRRRGC